MWEQLDPFRLIDATDPLLWWRGGNWMIGRGRLLTLQFSGPDRFAEAANAWADLSYHATSVVRTMHGAVTDETREQFPEPPFSLTGVRAFSSFAFADESPISSVIIVPELLIGYKSGQFWATRVWAAGDKGVEAEEVAAQVRALAEDQQAGFTQSHVELMAAEHARENHEEAVSHALHLVESGELSKVVLAREATATVNTGFDVRPVLSRLAKAYPTCWVFAVDGFFGASPETLVEVHSGELHARVLAGTQARPRGNAPAQAISLLTDQKERKEHEFAVRSVVDVLDEYTTDSQVEGPTVVELANVWHLATDLTATMGEADLLDVVGRLHPTAAVAGTPREAALDAISSLELEDRGRYGGPVGWLDSSDDGEFAVGIRSAQLLGTTVTAWAGGGIVEGSVPEREFDETEAKLAPIRDALAG